MRRYIPILLSISAMLLAACSGGSPTATSQPPTVTPPNVTVGPTFTPFASITPAQAISGTLPVPSPTPRPPADGELPIPLPGTLVSSATEDPNAGTTFTTIQFTETGGPNNAVLSIQINGDGTGTRTINDQTTPLTVKQTEIEDLTAGIDKLNFFGMQATFLGPPGHPEDYHYTLSITRGENSRTIQAQDGYIPDPLKAFFGKIVGVGVPSGPSFGPSPTPGS